MDTDDGALAEGPDVEEDEEEEEEDDDDDGKQEEEVEEVAEEDETPARAAAASPPEPVSQQAQGGAMDLEFTDDETPSAVTEETATSAPWLGVQVDAAADISVQGRCYQHDDDNEQLDGGAEGPAIEHSAPNPPRADVERVIQDLTPSLMLASAPPAALIRARDASPSVESTETFAQMHELTAAALASHMGRPQPDLDNYRFLDEDSSPEPSPGEEQCRTSINAAAARSRLLQRHDDDAGSISSLSSISCYTPSPSPPSQSPPVRDAAPAAAQLFLCDVAAPPTHAEKLDNSLALRKRCHDEVAAAEPPNVPAGPSKRVRFTEPIFQVYPPIGDDDAQSPTPLSHRLHGQEATAAMSTAASTCPNPPSKSPHTSTHSQRHGALFPALKPAPGKAVGPGPQHHRGRRSMLWDDEDDDDEEDDEDEEGQQQAAVTGEGRVVNGGEGGDHDDDASMDGSDYWEPAVTYEPTTRDLTKEQGWGGGGMDEDEAEDENDDGQSDWIFGQ